MIREYVLPFVVTSITVAMLAVVSCSPVQPEENNPPDTEELLPLPYSDLILNEVCTANSGHFIDENGEDPDWIELYNQGDTAIPLEGYALSDDTTNLLQWQFGNVSIAPKSYLLICASGKSVTIPEAAIPDDTVNILDATRWSDSIGSGGSSSIRSNEYKSIWPVDSQGYRIISAVFNLVDNRPELDWSALEIKTEFGRQHTEKGTDYSDYSSVELIMTLQKDRNLGIRIIQNSIRANKGAPVQIAGTGIEDDHYTFALEQGKAGLDLTDITGFYLHTPLHEFGTMAFTLKRIIFKARPGNIHADFKLSGREPYLHLSRPDSTPVDRVKLRELPTDVTIGRLNGAWNVLAKPTPGAANSEEGYAMVSDIPSLVTAGGFYDSAVTLVIQQKEDAVVYYTNDGSLPDTSGTRYQGPLKISSTTVLRYRTYEPGKLPSPVQTETFFIGETQRLPVVSVVVDEGSMFDPDTGLYMMGPDAQDSFPYFKANFWSGKELPANIALYETDGTKAFSIDAGVSIGGNWSKGMPKKSLTIDFREKYGEKELEYPVFPQAPELTRFKKLVLRNGGGTYSKALINEAMMQSLLDSRDVDHQQSRFVVVFINDRYFGVHHFKEPTNHDFVYTNYGYKKEEIDFFDAEMKMKWGTPDAWNSLVTLLTSEVGAKCDRPLSDSVFARVKKQVDVHGCADYHAFEIFINNTDWPANNCRFWRPRTADGTWRYIVYDLDAGFGDFGCVDDWDEYSHNTLAFALDGTKKLDEYPNGGEYTFPLRALMQSNSFRNDFINRFATLLATEYSEAHVVDRIETLAEEIRAEIPDDAARWDYEVSQWESDIDELKAFAEKRGGYVIGHLKEYCGAEETYTLTLDCNGGEVSINGLPVNVDSFEGTFFPGVPLTLTVESSDAQKFSGWSDGSKENPRVLDLDSDVTLSPVF